MFGILWIIFDAKYNILTNVGLVATFDDKSLTIFWAAMLLLLLLFTLLFSNPALCLYAVIFSSAALSVFSSSSVVTSWNDKLWCCILRYQTHLVTHFWRQIDQQSCNCCTLLCTLLILSPSSRWKEKAYLFVNVSSQTSNLKSALLIKIICAFLSIKWQWTYGPRLLPLNKGVLNRF